MKQTYNKPLVVIEDYDLTDPILSSSFSVEATDNDYDISTFNF